LKVKKGRDEGKQVRAGGPAKKEAADRSQDPPVSIHQKKNTYET